jgi:hypothetical protein
MVKAGCSAWQMERPWADLADIPETVCADFSG